MSERPKSVSVSLHITPDSVRLQVIRMALTREEEKAEGEHMEAIIGQQLVHPNVVRTLQSGSRRIQVWSLHMSYGNQSIHPF